MKERSSNGIEMPVLFIGHGSPENAIAKNEFTREWSKVSEGIPKPKLILCVSAHWVTSGTRITSIKTPKTIHDFYGFPEELYRLYYPAPGSPKNACEIAQIIKTTSVKFDCEWGLDHGAWVVLMNMYPKADIPVLQLSIDANLPLRKHYEIGKEIKELRKKGVLIIGSGNIVHNLPAMALNAEPFSWASEFDEFVKEKVLKNDSEALIHYTKNKHSTLAHPTNEHYLPLLYAIGASEGEVPRFFNDKIVYGSVSMRCVLFNGHNTQTV